MGKSRIKKGVSDLETMFPNVSIDWDYEKNELLPSEVAAYSHDSAYWKCHMCGYEWQAQIKSRSSGRGCPACGGQVVIKGQNDLATFFPEIASEWDYEKNYPYTPDVISKGAIKKYYWVCPNCKNSYEASVNQRTNSKSGCPYCSNHKVMPGYNDFATKYPQLAEEWDSDKNGELKPNMILCNYRKLVYWKCKSCGQSYEALTHNRIRGDACPYCSGHQVLKGVNDFATIHPELLSEWDYEHNSSPDQFTVGSSERVSWICSICGHKWKTNIVKRSNGAQCPKCNKRNHTSFPEQAIFYYIRQVFPDAQNGYTEFFLDSMELDIYIPSLSVGIEYDGIQWHTEKTEEREKKKYEICKRNKVTLIRVEEFKEDNQYCDIAIECSYRRRDYTALDSVINKIFEILKISGPIVDTEMDTVFINEQFLVEKKEGSFGALFPQYCEEWNYEKNGALSPMMFAPYSNEIVWWKCKVCGAEYRKAISGRARGIGCRNCSYKLRGQKLGERMRKRVRNVETGEIFQSLAEAAEKYGESSKNNHIGECCRGQRKTAYGYHWEYAINKE